MTIVIVGAGQGGYQVAVSLRDEGFNGRIFLVGAEPSLPYQRPPLSKAFLMGNADETSILLRPQAFFRDRRIELLRGETVVGIDRANKVVVFGSGARITFDHLVLATGARNRVLLVPGANLESVVQLRTLAHAINIKRRLEGVRRVVVVGAGFIGLEFSAVARGLGADVTVIEAADRVLSRAVSETTARDVQDRHSETGVEFILGATVAAVLSRDGRAIGLETQDGRSFPADLVLIGIGVVPNDDLAAAAGLEVANGILVDKYLATSDPTISAIGDCSCHPNPYASTRVRIESVQNAVDQARCLAARLVGRPRSYTAVPWFWSDQGSLKLQIAGLGVVNTHNVARTTPGANGQSLYRFSADRLVAVESINRPADHITARQLLSAGLHPTPEQVADPQFDLRGLVKKASAADSASA